MTMFRLELISKTSFVTNAPKWIQDESLSVLGVRALKSTAQATPADVEDIGNKSGLIQALWQDTVFS